jgi:hypothetical protein
MGATVSDRARDRGGLHQTLREWHLDELIEEAVLIASELVTNAISTASAPQRARPSRRMTRRRWTLPGIGRRAG